MAQEFKELCEVGPCLDARGVKHSTSRSACSAAGQSRPSSKSTRLSSNRGHTALGALGDTLLDELPCGGKVPPHFRNLGSNSVPPPSPSVDRPPVAVP